MSEAPILRRFVDAIPPLICVAYCVWNLGLGLLFAFAAMVIPGQTGRSPEWTFYYFVFNSAAMIGTCFSFGLFRFGGTNPLPLAFATSVCGLLGFGMFCFQVFENSDMEFVLSPVFWVFFLTLLTNVVWGLLACANKSPFVVSFAIAVGLFVFMAWARFL